MKPISTKLQFLLEAERGRPDAPREARAAVQANLTALLGPEAGLGDPEHPATAASGAASGAAATIAKSASRAAVAKLVTAFVIGGALGGGATASLLRPRERIVYVDRVAPVVVTAPIPLELPPAPSSAPAASAPPALSPGTGGVAAPSSIASAQTSLSRDGDLARERAILERARSALARGDTKEALETIGEHERKFPRGQLVEEREVLAVEALVAAGRVQEAAERGARFRKAFPTSLLLPVVDQALR